MSKYKRKDDVWVEGDKFSFGNSVSRSKRSRRESGLIVTRKTLMEKQRCLAMLDYQDSRETFLLPSPVSRRTRRQSMANLQKRNTARVDHFTRATSENTLPMNSFSRRKSYASNLKAINEEVAKKLNNASKSEIYPKNIRFSPVKTRSVTTRVYNRTENAREVSLTTNLRNIAKLPRNTAVAHLNGMKTQIKKPVKRLSTTPAMTPKFANKRLTRSAKRNANILVESPVFQDRKSSHQLINENNTSSFGEKIKVSTPEHVTSSNGILHFTPIPDNPSKILKQTMKKRIAVQMEADSNMASSLDSRNDGQEDMEQSDPRLNGEKSIDGLSADVSSSEKMGNGNILEEQLDPKQKMEKRGYCSLM